MPKTLSVNINKKQDDEWDDERLDVKIYSNYIVVSHSYPITPWKSNYDTILYLKEDDAILLGEALMKAATLMKSEKEGYRET